MKAEKRTEQPNLNEIRTADGGPLILRWTDIAWTCVIAVISFLCLELFHRMIVVYHDVYHSDIRYYVRAAADENSLHWKRWIELIFSKLYDINGITMEINIYLAAVIAGIIIVNFLVLRFFLRDDGVSVPRHVIQLFSITPLFVTPIYVPGFHAYYYRFSFDSFAWHSPTQQSMILFSMIATICFMKLFLHYEDKLTVRWWIWWIASAFTIFMSAYSKPSFFMDLAATVVILFIIELIAGGGKGFILRLAKLFAMGCTLIPAGIYLIVLNHIEYTLGASEDEVVIGFVNGFAKDHMKAGLLCGTAFALVVCIVNIRLLADRKYRFTACIFFTGVLQWLFLSEEGPSANYGNFSWGKDYGTYFILLISVAIALRNWQQRDTLFKGRKVPQTIYFVCIAVLFVLHVLSGLNYFRLVLTGHGYYI